VEGQPRHLAKGDSNHTGDGRGTGPSQLGLMNVPDGPEGLEQPLRRRAGLGYCYPVQRNLTLREGPNQVCLIVTRGYWPLGGVAISPPPAPGQGGDPLNKKFLTPEEQRPGSCPPNLNTDTGLSIVGRAPPYMSAGLGTSDISSAIMLVWGRSLKPVFWPLAWLCQEACQCPTEWVLGSALGGVPSRAGQMVHPCPVVGQRGPLAVRRSSNAFRLLTNKRRTDCPVGWWPQ
jgi:hypothetical protein